jgi:glycosyltransferase involved in cell wall biosynthesis
VPQTYQRLAYDYGMKRADAVLCQNRYQVAQFEQRLPSAPVHLIHNPFSIPKQLAGAMPREDRRYVAWLAVFRDGKNLPLLARLAKRLPHIRFRVGGMPEKRMSAAVGEAMAVLQSLPNVEMVGYVRRQDVMTFLSNAVALLSTSDFEGFSNTFLEAFAAGTPLVLRRQIDPDAIVAEKGLGFSARDEDDLAAALDRIWSMERGDFHELSARCMAYVREEHDPQAKVEQLMTVLAPLGVA